MTAGLAFRGVTGARAGRVLFERLSFDLSPGDAALVTGPNGVGKSTLIRIAAGLLRPVEGAVEAGEPCAVLTEATALDGERSLGDALRFWARLDPTGEADQRVDTGLEALDLGALASVPVRLLSTGQRRRAALARVVASRAPIWLLDEPANGLDAGAVERLERLIERHRADGGVALIASHVPLAVPGAVPIELGGAA